MKITGVEKSKVSDFFYRNFSIKKVKIKLVLNFYIIHEWNYFDKKKNIGNTQILKLKLKRHKHAESLTAISNDNILYNTNLIRLIKRHSR